MSYIETLKDAIRDYNNWVHKFAGEYKLTDDVAGTFCVMLKRRLGTFLECSANLFSKTLRPSRISIVVRPDTNYIHSLTFFAPVTQHGYTRQDRSGLLSHLKEAAEEIAREAQGFEKLQPSRSTATTMSQICGIDTGTNNTSTNNNEILARPIRELLSTLSTLSA